MGWWKNQTARHEAAKARRAVGPKVKVMKFKGDRAAARGIERMLSQGWQLENQSARKAVYSATAGLLTRNRSGKYPFRTRRISHGAIQA